MTEDKSLAATPVVHNSVATECSNTPTTDEDEGQGHERADTAPLPSRTRPAELGGVDAFLSHSWADEELAYGEKYRAIAAWAERFRTENDGQEPTIWLDKACIPQDDIATSLLCLPIFVSACDSLLVLLGPTYATRLWCVVELFTYTQMGGEREKIVVKSLVDTDGCGGVGDGDGGGGDGGAGSQVRAHDVQ